MADRDQASDPSRKRAFSERDEDSVSQSPQPQPQPQSTGKDRPKPKRPPRNERLSREFANLKEDRNNLAIDPMSQRNRSGRGSARNNGNHAGDGMGEEVNLWENTKNQVREFVGLFNEESADVSKIVALDKEMGAMDPDRITNPQLGKMENLLRGGVKKSDENIVKAKAIIDNLMVLRALAVAKEKDEAAAAGPSKRGSTRETAAAAAAMYDFDGAADSSIESPAGGSASRRDRGSTRERERDRDRDRDRDRERDKDRDRDKDKERDRDRDKDRERDRDRDRDRESERDKERDSIGPKAGSVEPSVGASTPTPSGAALARSKVVFAKGESVAFKPKVTTGEGVSDWILGEVAQVVGEGKSRRYKVLDIEPDDQSKQKEYKTSASSMIHITPESQADTLPDWDPKTTVLALYPNTTTFYRAEVHSMDPDGRVNLKFEGENDSSTLQQVERRFVIEYRA